MTLAAKEERIEVQLELSDWLRFERASEYKLCISLFRALDQGKVKKMNRTPINYSKYYKNADNF